MVDGEQCTIIWYVNNIKLSHKDEKVAKSALDKIHKRFPSLISKIGTSHKYLGLDVKFNKDKSACISMKDRVKRTIKISEMDVSRRAGSPADKNLSMIDEQFQILDVKEKEISHACVAKSLYVSKRYRLDVQLPISFVSSRVTKLTEQDWLNLKRVLKYLNGTFDRKVTIGLNDISIMHVFVDVSYVVHCDIKSHTEGCGVFFRGALMSRSIKQYLNTKTSCEAEVVGKSDYILSSIHIRLFLEVQSYNI